MKETLKIAKLAVLEAADAILKSCSGAVPQEKGFGDIVTENDLLMELRIKETLLKAFPEDAFIGEEANHSFLTNQRTWLLDPIDGSMNYALGLPQHGVQLALLIEQVPVLSVIYLPALGRLYTAVNGTAQLNGEPLSLCPEKRLKHGMVTFGDFSKSNPSSRPFQLKLMEALMPVASKMRIHGASSYDFALVASGISLAHILFSKRLWELAPGRYLAESAGAKSLLIDGSVYGFEGQGLIVASNQGIIEEICRVVETIPKGV